MATADEVLANVITKTTVDNTFVINTDLRTITIPSQIKSLGVESDDGVLRVWFKIPATYCGIDLSTFKIRINYLNAKNEEGVYDVGYVNKVDDYINFSWLIGRHAAMYKGLIKFIVCLRDLDSSGNVIREFNTKIATLPILEGLEVSETAFIEYADNGVYILVDDNGTEVPAVFVDNDVHFTATPNDIRLGKTAVTEAGVTIGEKEIPSYITTEGCVAVPVGEKFEIPFHNNKCEYTKLQALICKFNSSYENSVETDRVSIDGKVYGVNSTDVLATVTVDSINKIIQFGMTNNSTVPYIIRYITYKEEY